MDFKGVADRYLTGIWEVLSVLDTNAFEKLVRLVLDAYAGDRRIFVMGNGGSGATASHFACDLNKGCCLDMEKKFKVLCLNDNMPMVLAYANDLAYDTVFVEPLKNFFEKGDLVIGISASGNSENVLKAVSFANQNRGNTVGLCGFSGGRLAQAVHVPFVVRVDDMQKVEDVHLIITHMVMQAVYAVLHPESRTQ